MLLDILCSQIMWYACFTLFIVEDFEKVRRYFFAKGCPREVFAVCKLISKIRTEPRHKELKMTLNKFNCCLIQNTFESFSAHRERTCSFDRYTESSVI